MPPIISVRLTEELARRLEHVLAQLRREVSPIRVSRSDALRAVVERGLRAFERRATRKQRRR